MSSHFHRVFATLAALLWLASVTATAAELNVKTLQGQQAPAQAIWLDTLGVSKIEQAWGTAQANRSVGNSPLKIHGVTFSHGIGTHAESQMRIGLNGAALQFAAVVGIDDDVVGKGSSGFEIWVDGKKVLDSGVRRTGDEPKLISADLRGAKELLLVVNDCDDGIEFDHADWAGAVLVLDPQATAKPQALAVQRPPVPAIARDRSPLPASHGPRITGSTPGCPFLFTIPATGTKPLTFSARNLPAGLTLDAATGSISGTLQHDGVTVVDLGIKNALGQSQRKLTIVGGKHKLALTPPLGWNSWNCWAGAVSDANVRAAADAMVASGLAAHGFQYINIDDCWEGKRDAKGEIRGNEKFPDMKALATYIHSKGLRFGIYSSPGPQTCAGFLACWQHEQQDANTYAAWGVDYLKYDWCSYGQVAPQNPDLAAMQKPYRVMRAALDHCGRDIVFSLCQYGMGDVWTWGAEVGGNCWRTTGDIRDEWSSMSGIGFAQTGHERFAGPGHWNDTDMLVVGRVGWGAEQHQTKLKPDEELTHITLWSLQAAPMLIGCNMAALDDFTIALLTNDEVLDVSQDPLGKAAGRIVQRGRTEVWARPLADGTMAAGLFNRSNTPQTVKVRWSDLKLHGPRAVRDLWQQKDLGTFTAGYEVLVQPHSAALIKVASPR